MFQSIKKLSLIAGSNLINSILGFSSGIIIARELGAEAFGALATFIATMGICLQFAGQGIDWATVRYAAKYLEKDPSKSALYFQVMLFIKIILCLTVIFIGYIVAGTIAVNLLHKPGYIPLIRFAAFAAVGSSFCFFVLSYYQTTSQFLRYGIINILGNGSKFILVIMLVGLEMLSVKSALFAYSIVGFAGAILGFYWIPKGFFRVKGERREVVSQIINFSKWLLLATFLDVIYRRLDIFMIGYFENLQNVGIYSAAANIISALELLLFSVFTLLMPKVSKITTDNEYKEFISSSFKLLWIIAIPVAALYWLAEPFIVFFYSNEFIDAGKIFRILLAGFMVSLFLQPLSLLYFAKDRPDLFVYTGLILVVAVLLGDIIWIPRFGIAGAAYVNMAGRIIQGIIIAILTYVMIYRSKEPVVDLKDLA